MMTHGQLEKHIEFRLKLVSNVTVQLDLNKCAYRIAREKYTEVVRTEPVRNGPRFRSAWHQAG
jgi:hypothetical protein